MARFVPDPNDPRPVWEQWKDAQSTKLRQGKPPADVHAVREDGWVWLHPDGCRTEALPGTKAYPYCAHDVRATLLGRDGDMYVGTATAQPLELRSPDELF